VSGSERLVPRHLRAALPASRNVVDLWRQPLAIRPRAGLVLQESPDDEAVQFAERAALQRERELLVAELAALKGEPKEEPKAETAKPKAETAVQAAVAERVALERERERLAAELAALKGEPKEEPKAERRSWRPRLSDWFETSPATDALRLPAKEPDGFMDPSAGRLVYWASRSGAPRFQGKSPEQLAALQPELERVIQLDALHAIGALARARDASGVQGTSTRGLEGFAGGGGSPGLVGGSPGLAEVFAALEKWAGVPVPEEETPSFDASLDKWAEKNTADLIGNVNDYFVLRRDAVFGPFIEAAEIVGVDPSISKVQVAAGLVLGSVELYKRVAELALQCMASEYSPDFVAAAVQALRAYIKDDAVQSSPVANGQPLSPAKLSRRIVLGGAAAAGVGLLTGLLAPGQPEDPFATMDNQ